MVTHDSGCPYRRPSRVFCSVLSSPILLNGLRPLPRKAGPAIPRRRPRAASYAEYRSFQYYHRGPRRAAVPSRRGAPLRRRASRAPKKIFALSHRNYVQPNRCSAVEPTDPHFLAIYRPHPASPLPGGAALTVLSAGPSISDASRARRVTAKDANHAARPPAATKPIFLPLPRRPRSTRREEDRGVARPFLSAFPSFSVVQIDTLLMPSRSRRQWKLIKSPRLKWSWFW